MATQFATRLPVSADMTPTDLVCGMVTRGRKEGLQKYAKGSNTQAQAEQPENDPPGELEDDPVPRPVHHASMGSCPCDTF